MPFGIIGLKSLGEGDNGGWDNRLLYLYEHSERALALQTHEPRNFPRFGALSLPQRPVHYRDSAEFVPSPSVVVGSRDSPGVSATPNGDARAASITPGSRSESTTRGAYLPP
jgi:hypothetical protein